MIRTPTRTGFTLYELVVTVTIITMLMALLVPAINAARIAGQRSRVENELNNLRIVMLRCHYAFGKFPTMADLEDANGRERRYLESLFSELPFYWDDNLKMLRVDYRTDVPSLRFLDYGFVIKDVVEDHSTYDTFTLCAMALPDYRDGAFNECLTVNYDPYSDSQWLSDYDVTFLSEAALREMQASNMTNYTGLLGIAEIAGLAEDPEEVRYLFEGIQAPQVREIAWNVLNTIKEDENSGHEEMLSVSDLRAFAQPQATDSLMIAKTRRTVDDILTIQDLNDGRYDDLAVPLEEISQQPVNVELLFDTANIELLMTGMFSNAGVQDSVLRKFEVAQSARERGDPVVAENAMKATRLELRAQDGKTILSEDVELLIPLTRIMSPKELPTE